MLELLPETVEPIGLADAGRTLRGTVAVAGMARLAPYLHNTDGEVEVELVFAVDAQRIRHIRGSWRTGLSLLCQRCLRPMVLPMAGELSLALVGSQDEIERLPERYEPLLVTDRRLDLRALVEDELILALPIVPMHATERCAYRRDLVSAGPEEGRPADGDRQRPFAGLAEKLKASQSDKG